MDARALKSAGVEVIIGGKVVKKTITELSGKAGEFFLEGFFVFFRG